MQNVFEAALTINTVIISIIRALFDHVLHTVYVMTAVIHERYLL